MNIKKKRTLGLIALILISSLAFLLFNLSRKAGGTLKVCAFDECQSVPLNRNKEYVLNGGTNILTVENGQAYMSHADCPDKVCIGMGHISRAGDSIICLPNRVVITVEGEGELFSR